ncbi:MAG: YdcF family protein [Patescibacteria group bacterium]
MRYFIIPSCDIKPKNSLQRTHTEKRLFKGLFRWLKDRNNDGGDFDFIIVTGGIYLPSEIQTIPAGVLMRDWLLSKGIEGKYIKCEPESRDTFENINNSIALVASDSTPMFTVITHWQHGLRFWVTFRLAHKVKVRIIPIWYWIGWKQFLWEWVYLCIHLIDPKGKGRLAQKNRNKRTFNGERA